MEAKLYYANEVNKGGLGVRDLQYLISRKSFEASRNRKRATSNFAWA